MTLDARTRFLTGLLATALVACGGGGDSDNDTGVDDTGVGDTDASDVTTDEGGEGIPDEGTDEGVDATDTTDEGLDGSGDTADDADAGDLPRTASEVIGADGGTITLELDGETAVTVEVPAGALTGDVELSITEVLPVPESIASEYELISGVFEFGPAGQAFLAPIEVTLPTDGESAGRTMYWSDATDSTVFGPVASTFTDATVSAEVSHFSFGFAGRPSAGLCATADDCAVGDACVAQRCVAPVADVATWADGQVLGTATGFRVAPSSPACCFDVTGDGTIDNRLAALVEIWDALPDATPFATQLDRAIRNTTAHPVLSARGLDEGLTGHVDLSVFFGFNDVDTDGLPDTTLEERQAGDGVYRSDVRTLGTHGAQLGFPSTPVAGGWFSTVASTFTVNLPIYQTCNFRFHETPRLPSGARCRGEDTYDVVLHELRMEGTVGADMSTSADPAEPIRIGAAVRVADVVAFINATYADACACVAGMGVEGNLMVVSTSDAGIAVACDDAFAGENFDNSACVAGQRMCAGIPRICGAAPMLANMADVDTDGDGDNDAFSAGLLVDVSPASFATDGGSVQPPAENCGSDADEDGDGLVSCDDPYCWDDTNCGALGHTEWCRNGIDDDGDGETDCGDGACRDNLACVVDEGSGDGSGEGSGDAP